MIQNNRHFYRRILSVALPMMIQNGITNFVQMLDNVMVGQVGTIPMSGVAIVNQLLFVFNLCVFGAVSGAGIFTAQFKGREDNEGIRYTVRFKIMVGLLLSALGAAIFLTFRQQLIGLYLTGEGTPEDAAATMEYGIRYLKVMLVGLVPFALSNAYSGTMREVGETRVPMVAGIIAVLVNLAGNYILIFGHFGAPALGVVGAALATVISRFVELTIVACWTPARGAASVHHRGAAQPLHSPEAHRGHHPQGYAAAGQRVPVGIGYGIFEPVLLHPGSRCGGGLQHRNHYLPGEQCGLHFSGRRCGHSDGSDAGCGCSGGDHPPG